MAPVKAGEQNERRRQSYPSLHGVPKSDARESASETPSRRHVKVLPPLLHARPSHLRTGLLAMRCACGATDSHSPCSKTPQQTSRPVPTRNNHLVISTPFPASPAAPASARRRSIRRSTRGERFVRSGVRSTAELVSASRWVESGTRVGCFSARRKSQRAGKFSYRYTYEVFLPDLPSAKSTYLLP